MKDEIKEILDNFEKYEARYKLHNETQFIITHREIQILLDYITNLQQYYNDNVNKYEELLVKYSGLQEENERLKKDYGRLMQDNAYTLELEQENKVLLEKYSTIQILYNSSKLKNEKAIEYILNNKLYCFKYDDEELFEITTDKKAKDELLNILQCGDEE